jgi:hypothetical protein
VTVNASRSLRLRFLIGAVLLGAVVLGVFLLPPRREPKATAEPPAKPAPAPAPVATTAAPPTSAPEHSPLADELNAPGFDTAHDLVVLRGLIGQLTTVLHLAERPPLGDNADLVAALTGRNRRHVVFVPPNHPALRAGLLVDRWGTPYHFHARSADAIDPRSAGPDRVLFTADDILSP